MKIGLAMLVAVAAMALFALASALAWLPSDWSQGVDAARLTFVSSWSSAIGLSIAMGQLAYLAVDARQIRSALEAMGGNVSRHDVIVRIQLSLQYCGEVTSFVAQNELTAALVRMRDLNQVLTEIIPGPYVSPEDRANLGKVNRVFGTAMDDLKAPDTDRYTTVPIKLEQASRELRRTLGEIRTRIEAQSVGKEIVR